MTAPQLAPGQVIAGKYSIRSQLGYGGATATYAAVLAPGREVVARLLSPQLAQRGDVLASLQQAGAFTNSLPADTTAHILESGFDPQTGAPFTVTELVALPSLAQAAKSRPLPVADVVLVLHAIARAVDAAHAQRIAHGGLKPQNVFVGSPPQKSVRVVDFGMALVRGALPTPEGRSNAAPWMAPEQWQGAPPIPASDVFSAGLVAFFAATGKPYWRSSQGPAATDLTELQKELAGARVPASARARELGASLSVGFDAVLGRALAANPAERFASVSELAAALAKESGPQKMAMTMPINAMAPGAAQEMMRKAAAGAGAAKPASSATSAPAGGSTLAIPSPLEAKQWPPQTAPTPGQLRIPEQQLISDTQLAPQLPEPRFAGTQVVPQMQMPLQQPMQPQMQMPPQQPMQPQMQMPPQQPMQPQMQMAPQQPMQPQMQMPPQQPMPMPHPQMQQPPTGGMPMLQGPVQAQGSYGPPSYRPAPDSAVVVPKSRTGLIVGIVIGVLLLGGGAVGAISYLRTRAAAAAAQAAAQAATQAAINPVVTAISSGSPLGATPTAATGVTPSSSEAPAQATPEAAAPAASEAPQAAPAASESPDAAAAAVADAGAREQAMISIVCNPECDSIKIDDKLLDNDSDASVFPSPEPVNLSPGAHTITVGKAAYLPQSRRLTVKAGETDKVAFFLTKPQAAVPAKQCGKFLERCP